MLCDVGVYVMCYCRCLSYLMLEFMLCVVGIYMSTSAYKIPFKIIVGVLVKSECVVGAFFNELGWTFKSHFQKDALSINLVIV